ncbi:MAG: 3-oxoacyl-[acyl-carrier-protein] synthase III C-terminal domain-containing protein [Anaerolineae bacterium]
MTRYATMIGTGRYLPEIEVSNATLKKRVSAVDPELANVVDAFEESSGIRSRWYAPRDWATSDIALRAAQKALEAAGIGPEQLDMIGVATAAGLLSTNPWMNYVLVIGVYMMSKLAEPTDVVSFFYGDGAGAAVLAADSKPGFITSAYLADGSFADYWVISSGGTAEPASVESVQAGRTKVRLLERYPPDVNHVNWPKIVRALAERGGFDIQDIDLAIFTQVRLPSIKLVMEDLGLPLSKTHWIMEEWGYMGSACIPMALDDAIEKGKVGSGDLLVLVGSGVGYNYAGVALRMP